MKNIIEYLEKDYYELRVEEKIILEKIANINIEYQEVKKTIGELEEKSSAELDVFQASSGYYDDKEFSKAEIVVLNNRLSELEKSKAELELEHRNISKKIEEVKFVMESAKDYNQQLQDVYLDSDACKDLEKSINDIVDKLEFCKKIAVCDANRCSQEMDKIIRKSKKLLKLLEIKK